MFFPQAKTMRESHKRQKHYPDWLQRLYQRRFEAAMQDQLSRLAADLNQRMAAAVAAVQDDLQDDRPPIEVVH